MGHADQLPEGDVMKRWAAEYLELLEFMPA